MMQQLPGVQGRGILVSELPEHGMRAPAQPINLHMSCLQVDVGELLLDYGALITNKAFALRNLPKGNCKIRLSGSDMGNFMVHPLLQPVGGGHRCLHTRRTQALSR
jgi:hypothetical protein